MTKALMPKINFKKLENELYQQGLAGFRRIRDAHPNDTFYCFAFFTTGEFAYVAVTASSLEGLNAVAKEYKKAPPYKAWSIDDLKLALKWSPCDSPLHGADENLLSSLDPLMQNVVAEFDRRGNLDDDWKSFHELVALVSASFANAIRRIDSDGIFGCGEARKKVVVNLLMGDQSDEDRIEFAGLVNPPESIKMLKIDLKAADRVRR